MFCPIINKRITVPSIGNRCNVIDCMFYDENENKCKLVSAVNKYFKG